MKIASEVKTTWIDPLTFRELKINERVTLKSDNDIISDFVIQDIYGDNSILLKKPESKISSNFKRSSVILSTSASFDAKSLRQNDIVQIKLKNGKVIPLKINLIINKDFFILGPESNTKKLSLICRSHDLI